VDNSVELCPPIRVGEAGCVVLITTSETATYRRLRVASGAGPSVVVFARDEDWDGSDHARLGRLAHDAIGRVLTRTRTPDPQLLVDVVKKVVGPTPTLRGAGVRQQVAGLAAQYFWHLALPASWRFVGAEYAIGRRRLDLLHRDTGGAVLLDEVKAGHVRQLGVERTREQIDRYVDCAVALWRDRFLGIRLLSLSDPDRSVFVDPDGTHRPLRDTPYLERSLG